MNGHTYILYSNYRDALLVSNMKNSCRLPGYISLRLVSTSNNTSSMCLQIKDDVRVGLGDRQTKKSFALSFNNLDLRF